MSARCIYQEICAQIRTLFASVPPYRAPVSQQVAFQLQKAELMDLVVMGVPSMAASARDLATRARYEATQLANQF